MTTQETEQLVPAFNQNNADRNENDDGNDDLAIKSIIASVTIDVKLTLYTAL